MTCGNTGRVGTAVSVPTGRNALTCGADPPMSLVTMTEVAYPMGLKLSAPLICGACGKPRGLGVHLCKPGARRKRRTALANPVRWECGTCHQPRGLSHTCSRPSDFKARKRKAATAAKRARKRAAAQARAERRKRAAAERRVRDRAKKKAAKSRPRNSRPRGESHEPGACGNRDCPKYGCVAYWRGQDNCPFPHEGE